MNRSGVIKLTENTPLKQEEKDADASEIDDKLNHINFADTVNTSKTAPKQTKINPFGNDDKIQLREEKIDTKAKMVDKNKNR